MTIPYNNYVGVDDKGLLMYTVLFPTGRTEVFRVKSLAEVYVLAYRGVIIAKPLDFNSISHYNKLLDKETWWQNIK